MRIPRRGAVAEGGVVISTCRATRAERREPFPGDALVRDAVLSVTHAIDIAAAPERVWPWLAQMGAGRAGWYSWDRLDNGGTRSADRLVPELQRITSGDLLPAVPGAQDAFVALRVEPPRALLLGWPAPGGAQRVTWEFAVRPAPSGRTRLVVRARLGPLALEAARAAPGGPEPLAVVAQLRGIRRRAESLARRRHGADAGRVD